VGLCGLAATPDLSPSLWPLQQGVGVPAVPNASETSSMPTSPHSQTQPLSGMTSPAPSTLCSALQSSKQSWLISPACSPMVTCCMHTTPACGFRALPRTHCLSSPSLELDTIAPLLFALALQGPLQHAEDTHRQASILALHNDVTLQGPQDTLRAAVHSLHRATTREHTSLIMDTEQLDDPLCSP
jgi:hypothetical protein